MNERSPEHLTDADRINLGIYAAQQERSVIDDATARRIAMQLHSGQASSLYSFGSSGAIELSSLANELMIGMIMTPREERETRVWYDELAAYISSSGDRPPQPGWFELTAD